MHPFDAAGASMTHKGSRHVDEHHELGNVSFAVLGASGPVDGSGDVMRAEIVDQLLVISGTVERRSEASFRDALLWAAHDRLLAGVDLRDVTSFGAIGAHALRQIALAPLKRIIVNLHVAAVLQVLDLCSLATDVMDTPSPSQCTLHCTRLRHEGEPWSGFAWTQTGGRAWAVR